MELSLSLITEEKLDDMADVKQAIDDWVLEYSVKNHLNTVTEGTVSLV